MNTAEPITFNLELALERVGGDDALLRELAALFIEESSGALDHLRQAVEAHKLTAIQHLAHTLKGAASNFCADRTCEAALRLEMLGRAGTLDGVGPALAELESAMSSLCPQLAELTRAA
jgi:two-component system sensor histidine kinase/response regulator